MCRGLIRGEGENCWSQPFSAAAALSSFAITRSCNFAIRSLILRPTLMSMKPGDTVIPSRMATHDGFAEKVGSGADVSPEDLASGRLFHRFVASPRISRSSSLRARSFFQDGQLWMQSMVRYVILKTLCKPSRKDRLSSTTEDIPAMRVGTSGKVTVHFLE